MQFLGSPADIAIYGGSAGGGKTWALLMEPLRHVHNGRFGTVFFRRTSPQITNEGGLWDESIELYPGIGGMPRAHDLSWKFPSGSKSKFTHLEYEKTVRNYQGAQIPLICFDELTHFTEYQFFYMVSRNRSMSGVRPYIRATCNPDADSWVAKFIAWWIDQETGLAIPERSGVIRYFVRVGDTIHWASQPQDLAQYTMMDENGNRVPIPPKSVTFIAAKLTDNKALMRANPEYMANLMALSRVERERLLGGNWKIRPNAGMFFRRDWVKPIDAIPAGTVWVRGWDLGATPPTDEAPDPDFSCGVRLGRTPDGRFIAKHMAKDRKGPAGVQRMVKNTAENDGYECQVDLPQDPGQAGKAQVANFVKLLEGYNVRHSPETGDKVTRFSGFSAQAEAGNVYYERGDWNEDWFSDLEGFPTAKHDDAPDATSRAFNALARPEVKAQMFLRKKKR
ncbi:MAG: phage terminase large subunit [Thalassovita sp.]